jgi:hypothetical protein
MDINAQASPTWFEEEPETKGGMMTSYGAKDYCDCPNRVTCDCPYLKPERFRKSLSGQIEDLKVEVARLKQVIEPFLEKHESEDHYVNGNGDEYKRGWYSAMRNVRERLAHLKREDGNG